MALVMFTISVTAYDIHSQHFRDLTLTFRMDQGQMCKYTNRKATSDFLSVGVGLSVTVFEITTFCLPKWSRSESVTFKK